MVADIMAAGITDMVDIMDTGDTTVGVDITTAGEAGGEAEMDGVAATAASGMDGHVFVHSRHLSSIA
ncbi:MAG: hypothetical protein BGO67_10935 [Alphaproteobacteria bacterium 41-28]|nr:MAG: hypothetical protein BGO67_10935 [Alphaproteobacteria bacterium 41-28]